MLNSQGGMIIWGAPVTEKQDDSKEAVIKGELQPVPVRYEKDAFIAKIANRIIPSPKNVLFHRIEDKGRYIYLFDVAASDHAPHQFDNVYYMRMDGQTKAAPHAYIEALFKKIRYPELEAYLTLNSYYHPSNENEGNLYCVVLFRNLTPLINDENLYCKAISSIGGIHNKISGLDVFEITFTQIADVISYGNVIEHFFNITLSRSDLFKKSFKFEIELTFGGRYSPSRACKYAIDLGKATPREINPKYHTIDDCITPIHENVYSHELDAQNNVDNSKEEFLRRIGRK